MSYCLFFIGLGSQTPTNSTSSVGSSPRAKSPARANSPARAKSPARPRQGTVMLLCGAYVTKQRFVNGLGGKLWICD